MKTKKIKEIIRIVMFIKEIKGTEVAEKCSFSYTALCNYITKKSTSMTFEHIVEIMNAIEFPLAIALILSEKEYSRKELIEQILKVM